MRNLLAALAVVLPSIAFTLPSSPPRIAAQDDGRAGTVIDRQGLATVQPKGRERWTPLAAEDVLLPGDQVRTDVRGANAIDIALTGGGTLLLGPGARIELGRRDVHLLRGECELAPGGARVRVRGPGGFDRELDARAVLRAGDAAVEELEADPRWLSGYRSSTTSEWMGSLVAQVDGRDVTLAIARHHVDAVIRDQIAETTIDQVYRNATNQELEGVFTFPLPADASVSGFAMWIGGEMVEADVVERSRARQIYEDLKARKKDPGLLEWSGGNLFTARVWPIPANGEKRIRIRYTQVLPLEGDGWRYRTALRSEALRKNPVRDLSVTVRIASARAMAAVASPSHEVAATTGPHAATLEYGAQEVTPERDFEVRVALGEAAPVTVVDHVRDGEGYFMVLLAPPGEDAGWTRTTVPEGEATELCVIADTSGSMDARARAAQRELVAALLGTLGTADRFRLLTVDRAARWFREGSAAPTDANVAEALGWLDGRDSLGWTDLDAGFRTAFDACRPGALVVYVGDGMVTTGDADGQAFARRVAQLAQGKDLHCHAVTTSNAFDVTALDAIARIGGGSRRQAEGDAGAVARALLTDALSPSLRDASVSFEGLETARVYPKTLPNVPVGRQRAVLGRYRVTGSPQTGKVVVEGTLRGARVRFARDVVFGAGDEGNSFLPRLWARRHIDALLAEGPAAAVREEVVARSAEFGIMTPLTSFLVLDNDEDRERYGVTRRVRIRDGEQFFAAAREQAKTEALRKALQEARAFRVSMRERALREIAGLGKDLYGWEVAVGWQEGRADRGLSLGLPRREALRQLGRAGGPSSPGPATMYAAAGERLAEELTDFDAEASNEDLGELEVSDGASKDDAFFGTRKQGLLGGFAGKVGGGGGGGGGYFGPGDTVPPWMPAPVAQPLAVFGFPALGPPEQAPPERPAPRWPAEVLEALRAVDRRARLATTAVAIELQVESQHTPTGRRTDLRRTRVVWDPRGAWIVDDLPGDAAAPMLSWVLDGQRGVLDVALALGRSRAAAGLDGARFPAALPGDATVDLIDAFRGRAAEIGARDGDRVTVVLRAAGTRGPADRLTIDRARGLLLRRETIVDAVLVRTVVVEDVAALGELTLPARVVTTDRGGTTIATLSLRALDGATLDGSAARVHAELARALVVPCEDPKLDDAFEAVHAGEQDVAARLCIAAFRMGLGQGDNALAAWDAAGAEVGGRDGARTVALRLLASARRGEGLERALRESATALAARGPTPGAVRLASLLRDDLGARLGADERLALHAALRPVYADIRAWRARQADLLEGAGQGDAALAVRLQLVEEQPDDTAFLLAASTALSGAQRPLDAAALLEQAFEQRTLWLDDELDQIARTWAAQLWSLQDADRCAAALDRWIATGTHSQDAFGRRIAVDVYRDREPAAIAMARAIVDAPLDLRGSAVDRARVLAATGHLLGQTPYYNRRALLEVDIPELDRLARKLCASPGGAPFAATIVGDQRFAATDAGAALRAELRAELLDPARIATAESERYLALAPVVVDATTILDEVWPSVADALEARCATADADPSRGAWAGELLRLCDARADQVRSLAFLRRSLARADADTSATIAGDLLRRLATQPWSAEREAEMFTVGDRVTDRYTQPDARMQVTAGVARWTADQLERLRREATLGPVEQLEALPRAERRDREKAAQNAARLALAAVFDAAARAADAERTAWLRIEAICFGAQTADDRAAVRDAAVALLDAALDRPSDDDLARALRERASLALAHLAVRRGVPDGLADQILAIYRARAAAHPATLDWRAQEARLLVALDRADELLTRLDAWIAPNRIDRSWRLVRARMLAEVNRFDDAEADLRQLGATTWLGAAEWAELADWQLVRGDDRAHDLAVAGRLDAMTPWELQQLAWSRMSGADRRIDALCARALCAMMRKADDPSDHLWVIRNLYDQTKDFRALACLVDGAVGHSPEAAYRMLRNVDDVVGRVHEEATLDSMAAAITAAGATTPTDRRALALVRFFVERRASQVPQGAGAHRDAATAALRDVAADLGRLVSGERTPLADLLGDLGPLDGADARAARRAILAALLGDTEAGSDERLAVAAALARAAWAEGERDAAIDRLREALDARAAAAAGAVPPGTLHRVDQLVGWWSERGRFPTAESWLGAQRAAQPSADRQRSLDDRIDRLHAAAVKAGGATSLGSGAELFRAARARLVARMDAAEPRHLADVVNLFAALHVAAKERSASAAAGSLRDFAAGPLWALLPRTPQSQEQIVRAVSDALTNVSGPRDGLRALVRWCREEPSWRARTGEDAWSDLDWRIADLRVKAGELGDVGPDLRALVLVKLERDLARVGGDRSAIWSQGHRLFWAELREDYRTVAMRVLELRGDSDAVVRYVARYLWDGVGDRRGAVRAMEGLSARGGLELGDRATLADWLLELREFEAAWPHIQVLLAERTLILDDRLRAIRALKGLDRDSDARAMALDTEAAFDAAKRFDEAAQAALASACRMARIHDLAARFYELAIHSRERVRPSGPDNQLAEWYGNLASELAQLDRFDDAVEAASAGIVRCGENQDARRRATGQLEEVLGRVPDLDAWVARHDAQVATTGLDAPLIRKALGAVLEKARRPDDALVQYVAAIALQPNDREAHDRVIAVLDSLGRKAEACDATRAALRADPSDLARITQLATRLDALGQADASARAWTDLVEHAPQDADGHRLLAQRREAEERFADAVAQWQQVVRTRPDDPEGHLSLAQAQLRNGDTDGARSTLDHVLGTTWDARFGDVKARAAALLPRR